MAKREPCNNKKKHYLDKEELRNEVAKSKENNQVSDKLAMMFIKIVDGVAHKFGNLHYFGILEDAKQDCLELLLKKYKNFDPEIGTSSFAFFTTIVYRHFQYQTTKIKKERENLNTLKRRANQHFKTDEDGQTNGNY